jgi:hypothetical protein
MTDDELYAELKRHRLTPEMMAKLAVVPGKLRKRRELFVKVPWTWIEQLAKARYLATYRVALHVLYRHWKSGGVPFTLSNGMVAMEGVGRRAKWRALVELERFGLIAVERRKRRSPRITVLKS